MAETIDPRFMDVVNWTGQTTTILAPYGIIPRLIDPEQWRVWATYVVGIPTIAALDPPRPEGFDDWDIWARQFNVVARLLMA